MNSIVIGFSRPKKFSFFSRLIRLVENTKYSHVYIKFYSITYDRTLVYQASGLAVNFIEENNFNKNDLTINEFQVPLADDSIQLIQFCIDKVGTPYAMSQIFGIGLYLLLKLFGINIKNILGANKSKLICSELAEIILNNFTNDKINIDPNLVIPKNIYDILSSSNNVKRLL